MTFASVDLTSGSWVTGVMLMCALLNTLAAVAPHGTWSWQSATLTPGRARSARLVIWAGLLAGTATSIRLTANVVDEPALPADATWSMFFVAADANTSAGAPWLICVASIELAP